jgi:nucleoside-diphosphate-sugar epimerase
MILISGSNGFVGQNLVPKLIRLYKNEQLVCLTIKPRKKHERIGLEVLKNLKVKTIEINLLNTKTLNSLPKKPDLIIHLAASVDTADSDFRANDEGTKNLLSAIGPLTKKTHFIFISTAAVWTGRKNCTSPITELDPAIPNNEYGRTKLKAEKFLIEQSKIQGFSLTILRLNTVYGPDPREDKLFGVLKKMIENKSLLSRVNWPGKLGIIHVDDVVKTILAFTKRSTPDPQLYLISAENITLETISKLMYKSMNIPYKPIRIPPEIWGLGKILNYFIPLFERILPSRLYNPFWRAMLVLDNVLMASPYKVFKTLPKWKRKKFKDHVKEVINV